MRRFGEGDASLYHEEIATAVLNRVLVLDLLDRPEEALEACDEVLQRFGSSEEPYALGAVAQTLVNKGALLVALDRTEEGFAAWDEALRRFEASDLPALRDAAESALCGRAEHELSEGRARDAVAFLDRALLQARGGNSGQQAAGSFDPGPGRTWRKAMARHAPGMSRRHYRSFPN